MTHTYILTDHIFLWACCLIGGIVLYYIRTNSKGESTIDELGRDMKDINARRMMANESNKHDLHDTHTFVYGNGDQHFYGKDAKGTEHTWLTTKKDVSE